MPGENVLLEPGFEFLAETGLLVPLQGCGNRLEGARDCRFKIDQADEEDSLRTDGHLGNLALFPEGEGDCGDWLAPRIEITLADVVSRNWITTECADYQSVGRGGFEGDFSSCCTFSDGQTPPMDVEKLMVVALASWINQQEHVPED
jgi:hypothetical protein